MIWCEFLIHRTFLSFCLLLFFCPICHSLSGLLYFRIHQCVGRNFIFTRHKDHIISQPRASLMTSWERRNDVIRPAEVSTNRATMPFAACRVTWPFVLQRISKVHDTRAWNRRHINRLVRKSGAGFSLHNAPGRKFQAPKINMAENDVDDELFVNL